MLNKRNNTPNNQYTPLALSPADCHKYFQLKLMFSEHINTEIDINNKTNTN